MADIAEILRQSGLKWWRCAGKGSHHLTPQEPTVFLDIFSHILFQVQDVKEFKHLDLKIVEIIHELRTCTLQTRLRPVGPPYPNRSKVIKQHSCQKMVPNGPKLETILWMVFDFRDIINNYQSFIHVHQIQSYWSKTYSFILCKSTMNCARIADKKARVRTKRQE